MFPGNFQLYVQFSFIHILLLVQKICDDPPTEYSVMAFYQNQLLTGQTMLYIPASILGLIVIISSFY